jgi:hypothetical protein
LACISLQCLQDLSPFWTILLTTYDSSPMHNCSGLHSIQAMTSMAATLPINSIWSQTTTRFFSSLPACHHTSRSTPQLGESSLVAEALADVRHCHEKRLHNNQPEWTRGMRGVQQKVMAQQESEALADGRCWRDERQRNNRADTRHKRGMMRDSSAMRDRGAGRWEVAA